MTQPLHDYSSHDLLAFYYRVKPILAEWLAKPVWTAKEAALLCAGFVPDRTTGYGKDIANCQQDSIESATPIDSSGYIPADQELYREYLDLLNGKEAALPRDIVQLLSPRSKRVRFMDVGGQKAPVVMPNPFQLEVLREFQWFFIIGNAVGLPVPALVPVGLLDELIGRSTVQPISASAIEQVQDEPEAASAWTRVEKGGQSVGAALVSETNPKAKPRKIGERLPLQTTPEQRGYYTTDEVAGLTNLQSATLNKYAREGIHVEGFTPFKRHNGKFWQWRDIQQQIAHVASGNADQTKHRLK